MRVSPQKLNLVARSIRGLKVEKALNQLQFSSRRIAGAARKVLESAIANAENNHALNIDDLVVAEAYVGKNMVLRRWRPRARGRAAPIRKPFSQLTIIVKEAPAEDEPKAKSGRRRAGAAGESPSAQSPTAGALTASAPTAGGEGKG
ncbi:MAG: 50S ribosomal protein L22 [Hyphomicrobiales bacterium]|nr:50S ribosomal protein L22 [Hyphomicrobiales bacterium]